MAGGHTSILTTKASCGWPRRECPLCIRSRCRRSCHTCDRSSKYQTRMTVNDRLVFYWRYLVFDATIWRFLPSGTRFERGLRLECLWLVWEWKSISTRCWPLPMRYSSRVDNLPILRSTSDLRSIDSLSSAQSCGWLDYCQEVARSC